MKLLSFVRLTLDSKPAHVFNQINTKVLEFIRGLRNSNLANICS